MNNQGGLTREMQIVQDVQNALRMDPTTADYPIEASLQGTTLSISGSVDSQATKDRAEQIASQVTGVVAVINELVIGDDGSKGGGLFGFGRRNKHNNDSDTTTADRTADEGVVFPAAVGAAGLAGGSGTAGAAGGGGVGYAAAPLAAASIADDDYANDDNRRHQDTEEVRG